MKVQTVKVKHICTMDKDDGDDKKSAGGAVKVDYENVISNIVSLFTVVAPSHGSLLDISDMIHTTDSTSPPQPHIKLDREVCDLLSRDFENMKNNNKKIESILKQFLNFAGSGKPSQIEKGINITSGLTAKLAATTPILDSLTKLEWVAHICGENSVGVESLSTVLESGQQIWNLIPALVYCSLDCFNQLYIIWTLFGGYVNPLALGSGKTNNAALLDHENPQVVHAKQEIARVLEMRQNIMGSANKAPVPITEILLDIIIPVMKAINERLR